MTKGKSKGTTGKLTPQVSSAPSTEKQIGFKDIIFSLLSIIILGTIIYSNTFGASWNFDDNIAIVEHYSIRNLKGTILGGGSRWIGFITFALNYHFGKLDVFGYHLVNISIHLLSAILVYFLVLLSLKTPCLKDSKISHYKASLPLASGLIFVAHPIQTQAVTYIVQRFTSLATLFYLLSLLLFIKARLQNLGGKRFYSPSPLGFYLGSLLAAYLAMKTKEISFTLPAIIFLYEFCFFSPSLRALTRKLVYFLPLLLTFFIIPLSRYGIPGRDATQETTAISRTDYLLTQFNVIVTYIRLLFFPVNQNLDYDYPISHTLLQFHTPLSLLFLLSIVFFGVWIFRRSRLISFGIFWFFITLSVESSIIPIRDVIFEHRVYLPSVGFVICLTVAIYQMMEQIKTKLKMTKTTFIILILLHTLGTYQRNEIWLEDTTIWADTIRKAPHKSRPYFGLGYGYLKKGEYGKAIEALEKSIKLKPVYVEAYCHLGIAYKKMGLYQEAIKTFKDSLRYNPASWRAYYNLANTYNHLGMYDKAIEEYRKSTQLNPSYANTYNNLGTVYAKKGLYDLAIVQFTHASELNIDTYQIHLNLGKAYLKAGMYGNTIKEMKKLIKLKPNLSLAYYFLGNAYYMQGAINQAIESYKQSLSLEPQQADVYNNLGCSYYHKGLYQYALKNYQGCLNISSDHSRAHFNISLLYKEQIKDEEKSTYHLEKALRLNPSLSQIKNRHQVIIVI
jgi:tetratricopeptide (TPR) repeat protein